MMEEALKFSFIQKLHSGNIIIDTIISGLILTIISYVINLFTKNSSNFFTKISIFFSNICGKKNAAIILKANQTPSTRYKNSEMRFGFTILSLLHYIRTELKFQKDIYSKVCIDPETLSNINGIDYGDESIKLIYLVNQIPPFKLDENIYCKTTIRKEDIQQEKKVEKLEQIEIELFSKNPEIHVSVLEDFLKKCCEKFEHYQDNFAQNEQFLFTYHGFEPNDSKFPKYSESKYCSNRTFNNIFFEDKENIIKTINHFIHNKEWYDNKGIPYNLGILLYGSPGCGKTSLIKALLNKTKRHAIVINLSQISTCEELAACFYRKKINQKKIPTNKVVYIFEEFDIGLNEIFKDRNNETKPHNDDFVKLSESSDSKQELLGKIISSVTNKPQSNENKLNLEFFLTLLDGLKEDPGRIVVITTNHRDKLDPALIRPGRINIDLKLKKASTKIASQIISHFFDYDGDNDTINQKLALIKDYYWSPATITEKCVKLKDDIHLCIDSLIL